MHRGLRIAAISLILLGAARAASAQSIVGVLGALEAEIAPIARRVQNSHDTVVRGHVFRVGELGTQRVVLGRAGAGKVNAAIVTTLMIDHFTPQQCSFQAPRAPLIRRYSRAMSFSVLSWPNTTWARGHPMD